MMFKDPKTVKEWIDLDRMGVGKGWEKIVRNALKEICEIDPNLIVRQIKEKFGSLRIYTTRSLIDEKTIDEIILFASDECSHICEKCGRTGRLRCNLPWHKTLCDLCYLEAKVTRLLDELRWEKSKSDRFIEKLCLITDDLVSALNEPQGEAQNVFVSNTIEKLTSAIGYTQWKNEKEQTMKFTEE